MILLLFLLTALVGGTGAPLIKYAVGVLPPVTFVAIRAFLALIVILPFVAAKLTKLPLPNKTLVFANLLFATNWFLFAVGLEKTSVIMAQIIYVPTALIVALIGYFFLKEKLSSQQIQGLFLTMVGFSTLIFGSFRYSSNLSLGNPTGNLLVVIGLISWASYIVLTRKVSDKYPPGIILFYNFLATAIISPLILPLEPGNFQLALGSISANTIVNLVAVILITSIGFFSLMQWLIKYTSAFISSLVIYPVSIFGTLGGVIFYGEKITPPFFIGSILIFAGVFMATSYNYIKDKIKK